MKKVPYNESSSIYTPADIKQVLEMAVNEKNIIGNSKGERFFNVPCSFDIETTSFYRDPDGKAYDYEQTQKMTDANGRKAKLEKASVMYIWQFGINGFIIVNAP